VRRQARCAGKLRIENCADKFRPPRRHHTLGSMQLNAAESAARSAARNAHQPGTSLFFALGCLSRLAETRKHFAKYRLIRLLGFVHRMTLLNSRTRKGPQINDKTASGAGYANHRNTNSCTPFDTAPADECRAVVKHNLAYRHGLRAAEGVDLRREQFRPQDGDAARAEGQERHHPLTGREMPELRQHQRELPPHERIAAAVAIALPPR
jgi:hypothetical protein